MPEIDRPTHDEDLHAEMHNACDRLSRLETRLTRVETVLEHVATKADLSAAVVAIHQAINSQTWKIVGFGVAIVGASFALARYL